MENVKLEGLKGPEIVLGTATFQDRYGISSTGNGWSRTDQKELLKSAVKLGIKYLDTSPSYGHAERIIGEMSKEGLKFESYTKYSGINECDVSKVWESAKESLINLNTDRFSGFYFHNIEEMAKLPRVQLVNFAAEIRQQGIASKVGISVYTEKDVQKAIDILPGLDLLQVPENILDRRLMDSSLLQELHEKGVEIHVRSVFLQGLLLMPERSIPKSLSGARQTILKLGNYAREREISVLDLCINYIRGLSWADKLVIGCLSTQQLTEICNFKKFKLDYSSLPDTLDSSLTDPRFWNLT
jgi:aryl-alcohol dehydrogenase-like predicted oxidoreductase